MRWLPAALNGGDLGYEDSTAHCEHDVERPQRALVSSFPPVHVYDGQMDRELEIVIDTCPFAEEIHGNDRLCHCCGECRHQCAMDI